MELAKLSSKGQLVIPASVRKQMKIKPGTYFRIRRQNDKIILTPMKKGPLDRLYGKFAGETILESFEKEHAEEISQDNRS
ncbi:MAG: AbrB/MazE/SpoVT family DNA-binding domain-containing protein [Deltaproteobacteria bacterium]|nr:AbrB/MazE/SpoVT family DNA-binding domain-containing protein [Deltaproteobacteria bacterium]